MSRSRAWLGSGLLVCLLPLTGCQSGSEQPAPGPAASSPAASAAAGFANPVYDNDFPDPTVVSAGGTYWAMATNGNGQNVQTLQSEDLTRWEQGADALPTVAKWSTEGKVWAPEVAALGPKSYALYYTTMAPDPKIQCISVATGAKPEGPYVDRSSKPLVCEEDQGGSIDADAFTAADGKRYLYWKNDGNAIGVNTYLSVQQLDSAGTRLVGKPRRLFKEGLPWEGRLVEAPMMWENAGKYHMFYSANAYDSDSYAVGHAVANSPLGPFTKTPEPVLATNDVAAGPGHCTLVEKDGKVWMIYHAWPPDAVGSAVPGRTMWVSEVTFAADGSVSVVPPTSAYPKRP